MGFFGAIDASESKIVLAVGVNGNITEKISIATKNPKETFPEIIAFFKKYHDKESLQAIGISCFGSINLEASSQTFGTISENNLPAWKNFPFLHELQRHFKIPIGIESRVNAAVLGEYQYGAASGLDKFLYMSISSGIDVGGMIANELLRGSQVPEIASMIIPKSAEDDLKDNLRGKQSCLASLASGASLCARWKVKKPSDLPEGHKAWDLEAYYLAIGIVNVILCFAPEKIILGGDVITKETFLIKIRRYIKDILQGNKRLSNHLEKIDEYIVLSQLGDEAGIMGALVLAESAAKGQMNKPGIIYSRPWGTYETLKMTKNAQVKWIVVHPGQKLSLQKHNKRAENWIVAKGRPTITIGNLIKDYPITEMVYIPVGSEHRLENRTKEDAVIVEVQTGEYLGEDDIIRIDDVYGRK